MVSSVRRRTDEPAEDVIDSGPQILGLIEVTEYELPSLSPSRTSCLLKRSRELSERLDLGRSVLSCLGHLLNVFDLVLGITHRLKLLVRQVARHLAERLGQDLGSEPSLCQGVSETSFFIDDAVNGHTMDTSGLLQVLLEDLSAHSSICD